MHQRGWDRERNGAVWGTARKLTPLFVCVWRRFWNCGVGYVKTEAMLTVPTCPHENEFWQLLTFQSVSNEHKSCLYWPVNCFSADFHSVESGLRRSKYHVLGSRCYIWKDMFLSGDQVRRTRTSSFPFDHPSCFYPPSLLSDTVSSASLHRLAESWDWVQSMLQITRRKTTKQPITMADPLRLWSEEPNKVFPSFPLESHVFESKTSFSHYCPVWRGKGWEYRAQASEKLNIRRIKMLPEHHINLIMLAFLGLSSFYYVELKFDT